VESTVKYNGDIKSLADNMGLTVEVLNENFAIMALSAAERLALSKSPQIEYIEEQKIISFLDNPALPSTGSAFVEGEIDGLTGDGVLIAILDSGIDFTHKDFMNDDGTTRIVSIWDQNAAGTPPSGFTIGNEYSQEQINAALSNTADDNIPERDHVGHGTALAGAAAGNGRTSGGKYTGSAPGASLLIVRLAQVISAHFSSDTNLMRGIQYAADKAAALNMPLVINISYGTNQGAHDGSSLFEQYIDAVAGKEKTAVVISTGNEGAGGKHFQGKILTGSSIDARFTVQSRLESLNITMIKSITDDLELQIVDGFGRASSIIDLKGDQTLTVGSAQVIISVLSPVPYHAAQMITLILSDVSGNTLVSTDWAIRVSGISVKNGDINMWLPVTEVSGANTVFLFPEVDTSLTIPATVQNAITVGGSGGPCNSIADFSGRGFAISGVVKPEICAPAVNVMAASNGGGYKSFTGTGFAAPITAGICALMMQWGILRGNDLHMYGQRLKAFLVLGAIKHASNQQAPNTSWGYGELCFKKSLDYARHFTDTGSLNLPVTDTPHEIIAAQEIEIPSYMDIPNLITKADFPLEINPVTSEAYLNYLVQYDFNTIQVIARHPEILVSSILQDFYAVVHIPYDMVQELAAYVEVYSILERSRMFGLLANPALDAAGITAVKQPYLNLTGRGVLVGLVDTGIDYNLDIFKYENGQSKIVRIWDQTIESRNINDIPEGFIYGTEYTMEQINQAIASDDPEAVVPTKDEIGHGTFLASLIAGRKTAESEEGAAPDAEVIVVKLKQAKQVTRNYSAITSREINAYDSVDVLNGVEYLTNIARALNRPIAICLGIGTSDSAHDGLTYIERYLSLIAGIPKVSVIAAAGNEGDAGHHAAGRLTGDEDMKEIEFNVSDDVTGLFMRMWAFPPDRLSISIITPLGNIVERRKFMTQERVSYNFVLEKSQISIDYQYPNPKNGSQTIIIRILTPQPGIWKLRVYGDLIIDGRYNIWMPVSSLWSDSTYFLQPEVSITVTTPATAPALISVGAYNSVDGSIFISSSRGPNRRGEITPDLVAPGVNVIGVFPGGINGTMTGTSVSAAITAGACALILQWAVVEGNFPTITNYTMISFLFIGLIQRRGIIYPDNLWGYGTLNLYNSFRNI